MRNSHTDLQEEDLFMVKGTIEKDTPIPQSIEEEIIIKCSLGEITKDFFKDYVILWHDPNMNSEENQKYIVHLRKFCDVFTFTEWQNAKDFIQNTNAACHVITSGKNGKLLVSEISLSQNLTYIYVFCADKDHHLSWTQNHKKVSCVETDIEMILSQIQQNLMEWYKQASSRKLKLPAFAPIFNDSDKSQMNNLHRFLKVIPNFQNRLQAKNDFLNLSKEIYYDKKNQKLISDFDQTYNEYDKEQTLRWYTQESFLYKVTNNCLRIATSDSIQYCRLPLQDIQRAIKEQYQTKSKDFNGLLYRGAYLTEEEWKGLKANLNREIEMHGFLSVSKEKKVALKFMSMDPSQKVFVTIIVLKGENEEKQGFAEVEEFSRFPKEKEILFNVRSRFTVLETEDEYSQDLPYRHLVLLYGAQEFRKFIAEQNPSFGFSIPILENLSCHHCKATLEKMFLIPLTPPQNQMYFCQKCIDINYAPFLCVSPINKGEESFTVNLKGYLLVNLQKTETPFYGYKCNQCQAKKQKQYFACTDCSAKWCQNCFESPNNCAQARHNVIMETHPFSFWTEKMSKNESDHIGFQNDLLTKNSRFQQAQMYSDCQLYEKEIQYYSMYIQQNEAKDKDYDLATCYTNLGEAYDTQGEYKMALEYHSKSLEILKTLYGDNHPDIAYSLNNIGGFYHSQGEYKKALEYYFQSLDIRKSLEGDYNIDIAASYNSIGILHENQAEHKMALEYFFKALDIFKLMYGESHPHVATSYNNIGMAYGSQGEYQKALGFYLKCLDIEKALFGEDHPDVANSYNNIGLIYKEIGEYKTALECHSKSLKIYKATYGDNHPYVAIAYNNIGLVNNNQGDSKNALEFYLKCLDIEKVVYGDNHPNIATTSDNIGLIYNTQGDYKKAFDYHSKSLAINKAIHGENHPDIATSYDNLGKVYGNQGDHKKALEYALKSLDIRKSFYGDAHPHVATSYCNVGFVYDNQGEYQKALEYYLKCHNIYITVYGESHPNIALSSNNLGWANSNLGEYEKALEHYLKSLEIRKATHGAHNPDTATTYNNIGLVYRNQGEYKKALNYFLQSLEILKSVYGDEHKKTRKVQTNILETQSFVKD